MDTDRYSVPYDTSVFGGCMTRPNITKIPR